MDYVDWEGKGYSFSSKGYAEDSPIQPHRWEGSYTFNSNGVPGSDYKIKKFTITPSKNSRGKFPVNVANPLGRLSWEVSLPMEPHNETAEKNITLIKEYLADKPRYKGFEDRLLSLVCYLSENVEDPKETEIKNIETFVEVAITQLKENREYATNLIEVRNRQVGITRSSINDKIRNSLIDCMNLDIVCRTIYAKVFKLKTNYEQWHLQYCEKRAADF